MSESVSRAAPVTLFARSILLAGLSWFLHGFAAAAGLPPAPAPAPTHSHAMAASAAMAPRGIGEGASREAWASAAALSRGVNLSVFAAPREGDWGLVMDDRWVDTLAQAGFRNVRIPVRWSNHAATTVDATLDESFARSIDRLIDACLARQQMVVLAMIFYSQLDDSPLSEGELPVAPEVVHPRFVNLWRQLAERYASRSDRLIFEIYNSPRGDPQRWNELSARALSAIRKSNPHRLVALAPMANDPAALPALVLPDDRNLIVTFHNRDPKEFTSQGSPWVAGSDRWLNTDCCSSAQREALKSRLNMAKAWSDRYRYPVWLGSFGAVSTAPMAARARYLRAMRDEAEARGISWSHVDFAANFNVRPPPLDSGIYDVVQRQWARPLLDALLGP